jgi:excisionase family DNA binding protein
MRPLSTIAATRAGRVRAGASRLLGRGVAPGSPFPPLIDARAAGRLLGVPHTWLLAQARAGKIPHHRLGHYVRFNPEDLAEWLRDTRITPAPGAHRLGRPSA